MGCGGSKPAASPKKNPKSPRRGAGSRAQSRKSGSIKSTPRHNRVSPSGDAGNDRGPPKGVRKHSEQTKHTVPSRSEFYAPVSYEKENIPLEGNWEIENGVDTETPITDLTYPPPKGWKPVSDKLNFIASDFETIRNNDLNQACGPFDQVAHYLTKDCSCEILKVRVLVTWMSCQKIRTRPYGQEAKPGTVLAYMKRIKEGTGTYAGLLANLCRSIHIPCVIIRGIYKSSHHQVGEDDLRHFRSTWNAVHVDGSWQLVHPYLVCTPLATKSPLGNWNLLQTSRGAISHQPGHILNMFFFAPKPQEFIYCCIPDEIQSYWQFLDVRIRYPTFLKFPFLRPAFFSNNMELKSNHESVLMSENGMCLIRIKCDAENIKNLEFSYDLYTLDTDVQEEEEWGNLVFAGRTEDTWYIQVKFPVDGIYKLAVYGQMNNWFFWLSDFKINCDKPMEPYIPSPQVPEGWGPAHHTEEAGLLDSSHQGGIIFFKPGDEHIIKFFTHERVKLRCRLYSTTRCDLEHAIYDTDDLEKFVKVNYRRHECDVIVTLPLSGEFVLLIYTVDESREEREEKNVCNYLFVDWDDGRKRENVFQRRARAGVRRGAAGHDPATLEIALTKFRDTRLNTQDDDYIRGARRHNYLALKKKLRDAEMRRHERTLADAVHEAETSSCRESLEPHLARCRALLESLQQLDIHCHPVRELDHVTIAEIANFAHPPRDVHQTMIAAYLLLGENRTALQKWGYIQGLLRRPGREGLKARIDTFSQAPVVDDVTMQLARQVFDGVIEKYILAASLSATTVYKWVEGTLACLQNTSQNAMYSTYDDMDDVMLSIKDEEDGDETLSQDEGFLDSNDVTHGSTTQEGGIHGSATHGHDTQVQTSDPTMNTT